MNEEKDLPQNWIKTQSKSRPGTFYYFNIKTKESKWEFPSPPKIRNAKSSKSTESIKKAEDLVISAFKNGSKFFFSIKSCFLIIFCSRSQKESSRPPIKKTSGKIKN